MVPLAALLDLTSDVEVTTALLDDPLAWRVRVVEQIDIDSPVSALRRRSLQCAPRNAERALVVLRWRPCRRVRFWRFDSDGPEGGDAFLLPRRSRRPRRRS